MIVRKRHGFSARFKGFGNEVSLRYVNSSETCYPNETRVGQGTKSEACVVMSQLILPPPTIVASKPPVSDGQAFENKVAQLLKWAVVPFAALALVTMWNVGRGR